MNDGKIGDGIKCEKCNKLILLNEGFNIIPLNGFCGNCGHFFTVNIGQFIFLPNLKYDKYGDLIVEKEE